MHKSKNISSKLASKVSNLWAGISAFERRLTEQKALYSEVCAFIEQQDALRQSDDAACIAIADTVLFRSCLQVFGPALDAEDRTLQLESLYEVAVDRSSGALIIANKGATLWCQAPRSQNPFLARHIGLAVYLPGMGIETANVALVGDVFSGRIVCRSESACAPSFLFGSQRCNCAHQWDSCRELAAYFNPAATPALEGREFEHWVRSQWTSAGSRQRFKSGGPGFVLLHLDCQNGMGSGYSAQEFSVDLHSRASLRHRGEYSAEQILETSMADGFRAIGLPPDPRSEENQLGYQLTPIIMDYLGTSRDVILLSNNRAKVAALEQRGYRVARLKSLGAVNAAGSVEAYERGSEFAHMDIDECCISFAEDFSRLQQQLNDLLAADRIQAKAA